MESQGESCTGTCESMRAERGVDKHTDGGGEREREKQRQQRQHGHEAEGDFMFVVIFDASLGVGVDGFAKRSGGLIRSSL